ncbi:MAG TPA: dTMP kinase [Blastocatellia bacterium]|nr:dTMP kinase [Blastocatellia bacterium]
MSGSFITLEGIDGCGKSTQLAMLADALRALGNRIVVTREPGGTTIGERIRELLSSDATASIQPATELLMIVGARAQHVADVIRPSLEGGLIVISDRYTDSSVAFQGYGRGLDLAMIDNVNLIATGGLTPDLTILFDLEAKEAQARLDARRIGVPDRKPALAYLDELELEFHTRVREGYLKIAAANSARVKIVDASGTPEKMHAQVMALVLCLLSPQS